MLLFDVVLSLSQLDSMRSVHGMGISNDRDGNKENAHHMEIKSIAKWGRSSVGRALEWHSRGRGFKSLRLHQ